MVSDGLFDTKAVPACAGMTFLKNGNRAFQTACTLSAACEKRYGRIIRANAASVAGGLAETVLSDGLCR